MVESGMKPTQIPVRVQLEGVHSHATSQCATLQRMVVFLVDKEQSWGAWNPKVNENHTNPGREQSCDAFNSMWRHVARQFNVWPCTWSAGGPVIVTGHF